MTEVAERISSEEAAVDEFLLRRNPSSFDGESSTHVEVMLALAKAKLLTGPLPELTDEQRSLLAPIGISDHTTEFAAHQRRMTMRVGANEIVARLLSEAGGIFDRLQRAQKGKNPQQVALVVIGRIQKLPPARPLR